MKKRVTKKKSGEYKGRWKKRKDEKILDEKMEGKKTNRKSVVLERIRKVKRAGSEEKRHHF